MGDIESIPCVSVLQNGQVKLGPFKNYLTIDQRLLIVLNLPKKTEYCKDKVRCIKLYSKV